jgi:hypothetical protein
MSLLQKVVVLWELAEAQGQFGNPEEGECLQLEALTREPMKAELTE